MFYPTVTPKHKFDQIKRFLKMDHKCDNIRTASQIQIGKDSIRITVGSLAMVIEESGSWHWEEL